MWMIMFLTFSLQICFLEYKCLIRRASQGNYVLEIYNNYTAYDIGNIKELVSHGNIRGLLNVEAMWGASKIERMR